MDVHTGRSKLWSVTYHPSNYAELCRGRVLPLLLSIVAKNNINFGCEASWTSRIHCIWLGPDGR